MQYKADTPDVGVIIGRFQVPRLHEAHKDLIQTVCDNHDKVLLFLGLSDVRGTKNNPLDFESRKQMILDEFPQINVHYLEDQASDEVWSQKLDAQIGRLLTPSQTAVLYGGRDAFISHYSGRYPTQELEQKVFISGSEIRKEVSRRSVKADEAFREGAVWQAFNRYPTTFPTIDVAIFNEDETKVLLGRKTNETRFRFIGGFVDPQRDDSLEGAVRRETHEEAGIDITDPTYVKSLKVDDWRYRGEEDKIMTSLFKARKLSGAERPGDDIAELRWFDVADLSAADVVSEHEPLLWALEHFDHLSRPWSESPYGAPEADYDQP